MKVNNFCLLCGEDIIKDVSKFSNFDTNYRSCNSLKHKHTLFTYAIDFDRDIKEFVIRYLEIYDLKSKTYIKYNFTKSRFIVDLEMYNTGAKVTPNYKHPFMDLLIECLNKLEMAETFE